MKTVSFWNYALCWLCAVFVYLISTPFGETHFASLWLAFLGLSLLVTTLLDSIYEKLENRIKKLEENLGEKGDEE